MKICTNPACPHKGKLQGFDRFSRDHHSSDGYRHRCKTCTRSYACKYYEKNSRRLLKKQKLYAKDHPQKIKETRTKWRKSNPEMLLLQRAKHRAKRDGITFSISLRDVYIPTHCPLLGLKLRVRDDGKRGALPSSPSLDRKIPTRGYVPGNVWVISYKANRIKNDSSLEDLELLVRNLGRLLKRGSRKKD
jgi:hypothetical protein